MGSCDAVEGEATVRQACLNLLTRFAHRLGQYFIDERLVQFPFFLGGLA